jgi:hypothetical protein
VLKNTVDLEPLEVQAAAKEKMDALVLSYQHLDSLLDMAREGNSGGAARAVGRCCAGRASTLAAICTSTTHHHKADAEHGVLHASSSAGVDCRGCCCCCCTYYADAVPKAQEQIKETMVIAADIESFVKQTLGV